MAYNTRHAKGMDGRVDLGRLASRIASADPDLVALQELDRGTARSGGADQIAELGRLLGLYWAFGAFMEYDGGLYGLGVLSRFPIVAEWIVPIPDRKEPRVALFAEAELPSGERVCVADIHFDCLEGDAERVGQARRVAAEIQGLAAPCVLMGDFNDDPDSRTVRVFREFMLEAAKPEASRLTYPSERPAREIDFVFLSPPERWSVRRVKVVADPLTSDHLPIVADLRLKQPDGGL